MNNLSKRKGIFKNIIIRIKIMIKISQYSKNLIFIKVYKFF
jgi:hypothetical protein